MRTVPTSKIHRATVIQAVLHHGRGVGLGADAAAPAPGVAGPVRGDTIGA